MIRQEHQGAVLVGVIHLDPAQPERTFRSGLPTRQLDDFIPQDSALLRNLAPLDHPIHGVGLQAGDDKDYLDNHNQQPQVFVWSAPVTRILAKIAKCKEALDSRH